jgi:hypothetical protein
MFFNHKTNVCKAVDGRLLVFYMKALLWAARPLQLKAGEWLRFAQAGSALGRRLGPGGRSFSSEAICERPESFLENQAS